MEPPSLGIGDDLTCSNALSAERTCSTKPAASYIQRKTMADQAVKVDTTAGVETSVHLSGSGTDLPTASKVEELRDYAYVRFGDHLKEKFHHQLRLFKAARVVNSAFIKGHSSALSIDLSGLLLFEFIKQQDIAGLQ